MQGTATCFSKAIGIGDEKLSDLNWLLASRNLLSYVYNSLRTEVVSDFTTIAQAVESHWSVSIVEVSGLIKDMGPMGDGDGELGRFSIRPLGLFEMPALYIVLRHELHPERKCWALLHELGHCVYHFQMIYSLTFLYKRVCLDPRLEQTVGEFVAINGRDMVVAQEIEADEFAVSWLVPVALDDEIAARSLFQIPKSLTIDGYKYKLLRDSFEPAVRPLREESISALNERADEERRHIRTKSYPIGGSLWSRASWVLFNRNDRIAEYRETGHNLQNRYFELLGYPPRHFPELTFNRPSTTTATVTGQNWIRRVSREAVEKELQNAQWAPFLIPASNVPEPRYYLPIRPMHSRDPLDNNNFWQAVFATPIATRMRLDEWINRAQIQGAGLLVFARNPAEKHLDLKCNDHIFT